MANPYSAPLTPEQLAYERSRAAEKLFAFDNVLPSFVKKMMKDVYDQLRRIVADIDAGKDARPAVNRYYDHQDNVAERSATRNLVGGLALGAVTGAAASSIFGAGGAGAVASKVSGIGVSSLIKKPSAPEPSGAELIPSVVAAPAGAANVAPHLAFTSTPGASAASNPKTVAPVDMNWILIGAAFLLVAVFLMKGIRQ